MELGQDFLEQNELIFSHRLDNEASIVAEEEETSTGSCCLSSFEDLVAIGKRVERPLDLVEADFVHDSQSLEDTRGVGFNFGSWQSVSTFLFARWPQIIAPRTFKTTMTATLRHRPLNKVHTLEHI